MLFITKKYINYIIINHLQQRADTICNNVLIALFQKFVTVFVTP